MKNEKSGLQMLNFRVPRNLFNRLRRASAIQGISQTAIVISAIDRELSRWEREYADAVKLRKELGFGEDENPAE